MKQTNPACSSALPGLLLVAFLPSYLRTELLPNMKNAETKSWPPPPSRSFSSCREFRANVPAPPLTQILQSSRPASPHSRPGFAAESLEKKKEKAESLATWKFPCATSASHFRDNTGKQTDGRRLRVFGSVQATRCLASVSGDVFLFACLFLFFIPSALPSFLADVFFRRNWYRV